MTENIFRKFNALIFQAVHQFYVWRHLQRTENNSAYNARGHFWATVITTLHQAFLLNLANIFDEKDNRVLSVFTFLDHLKNHSRKQTLLDLIHSPKYENALKRLSQWRNNMLAHKNMRFVLNPKKLSTKFPFTYEEIENLLELLTEILNQTTRDFDPRNATDYSAYYRRLDEDCRGHTDFVLNNGLHTEAYKKIKKLKE
jgi:hypothetical protein